MTTVMEKFFSPKSVCVIGASGTPGKPGNVVIRNMHDAGFKGKIYLVNPRGGEIEGHKVYPSIDELPDNIDQAVVTLPASGTPDTVRALGKKNVEAIILAASGFAEVDQMGEALQQDLIAAIRESGARVIGPNTTGHISVPGNYTSSFFPLGELRRGSVSYITQTGNFCGISIRHILSAENYGIARSCGLGNKADLDECDLLNFYDEDPETKSIFLYLESIKNPKRFLQVARRVSRNKPVFLLKGGASDAGAAAAIAHTGSLAADGRIVDGALEQAGVTRLAKYSQLFHVAKALDAMPLPKGNRVSFLSPSGAFTVCLTDICRTYGLDVPDLEEKTRQRLQQYAPPFIRMRNPVDIFGSVGLHGYELAYGDALEAVLLDRNIDAAVVIMMLTTETGIPSFDFIVDLAKKYPTKPVYVTFMGQHEHNVAAKAYLEPRGVPCYMEVEQPFEVLSLLATCRGHMGKRQRPRTR
jgi:acyl-CoA synthetase (NDP forming)